MIDLYVFSDIKVIEDNQGPSRSRGFSFIPHYPVEMAAGRHLRLKVKHTMLQCYKQKTDPYGDSFVSAHNSGLLGSVLFSLRYSFIHQVRLFRHHHPFPQCNLCNSHWVIIYPTGLWEYWVAEHVCVYTVGKPTFVVSCDSIVGTASSLRNCLPL